MEPLITMTAMAGQMPVFSERPGCRERHLQRKAHNPLLFRLQPPIDQAMVDAARRHDLQEQQEFESRFARLLQEMAGLRDTAETTIILQLKEQIDRLYIQCAGLGGDFARERQALLRLHDVIMAAVLKAAGDDPLARDELDMEQAAHVLHLQLLQYPVVADLLRTDSPVAADELIPTLLAENEDTLPAVLGIFDSAQLLTLCAQARELLDAILAQGHALPSSSVRLRLMEAALQAMGGDTQGPGMS